MPLDKVPDSQFTESQLELLYTIYDSSRNKFARLAMKLDDSFAAVINTVRNIGEIENTIIIVSSDNGGCYLAGSTNWPLRGSKNTLY